MEALSIKDKMKIIQRWDSYDEEHKTNKTCFGEKLILFPQLKGKGNDDESIKRRINAWKKQSKEQNWDKLSVKQQQKKRLKLTPPELSKTIQIKKDAGLKTALESLSKALCNPEVIEKMIGCTRHIIINEATQITLDEDNIKELNNNVKGIDFNCIKQYIEEVMGEQCMGEQCKDLGECKLLIQQNDKQCAQTVHCDMKNRITEIEKVELYSKNGISGIMLLHDGPRTVVHDIPNVKLPVTLEDIYAEMDKFEKVPDGIKQLISHGKKKNQKSLRELLQSYGILFFANKHNRPKTKGGKAHEITIFEGNQPHFGPGTESSNLAFRVIVFFTMSNGDQDNGIYKDTQFSREKLIFEMIKATTEGPQEHEDLEARGYLYRYMAHVCEDIASYGGVLDQSILYGTIWQQFFNQCQHLIQRAKECKLASGSDKEIKKKNLSFARTAVEIYGVIKVGNSSSI